jgi:hypothetical protein
VTQEVSERGTVGATFAGILMIIGGMLGVLQGIGLVAGGIHYVEPADYWINTSVSAWGWVHLIVGLVVLAAGFRVMSGVAWAPLAGHPLRQHPGDMEFPLHPISPWASIVLIVVDLWIVHALFVHRREPV